MAQEGHLIQITKESTISLFKGYEISVSKKLLHMYVELPLFTIVKELMCLLA